MKARTMVPMMLIVVIAACVSLSVLAQETQPDVQTIVKKVDELYRSKSSYGEVEMRIVTPHWKRTLTMKMWSEGMKKTFITILSPKKDKGIATLRVGNEMWNYFPKINKVMKIPPSMMMGSWMGSDFTNDDIVKESTLMDDYTAKLVTPQGAEPDLYYIELRPKEQTVSVWGRIVTAVKKEGYLPVRQEYYDEDGKKMRIMTFTDVKELGGRTIPSAMEIVPLHKENHKTIVRYKSASFDLDLPKDVFTLRNLKRRR